MAQHSTLPAFKTALLTALQAAPALTGVQVARSHPGDTETNAALYFGDAKDISHIPVSRATRVAREENYVLDVWIDCQCPGPDAGPAEAQSFMIMGAIEDTLAVTPNLGVDGVIRAFVEAWENREGMSQARLGWASQLKVEVAVQARLT